MKSMVANVAQRLGVFRQAFELLGISLWIAWVLLIYSGEFFFNAQNVSLYNTFSYLVSTTSISLVFFIAGVGYAHVERIVYNGRLTLCGGLLASAGSLGMMFLGISNSSSLALLLVSTVATGVGTGFVALRSCLIMGELSARNAFITSSATLLQAFLIYLAVLGLPSFIGAGALVLFPLLAAVNAFLYRVGEEPISYTNMSKTMTGPLWRMTAALFILAIVFSLSRGMYPDGLNVSEFNDSRNYAALGSMAFCFVMMLLAMVLPRGTSFGQTGYWLVVAIIFLTALFPILGLTSVVTGVASTVANSALGVTVWALFGATASLARVSPIRVYGLGFSAFMMGSAIGWPIGYAVSLWPLSVDQDYVGFALFLVVLVVVFTLFRQSDLIKMIRTPDEDERTILPDGSVLDETAVTASETFAAPSVRELRQAARRQPNLPSWKARMTVLAETRFLTERETEVFLLLAKGNNARAISDALGFSYNTARVHVRNIYAKLDAHSRSELLEFVNEQDRRLKGIEKERT